MDLKLRIKTLSFSKKTGMQKGNSNRLMALPFLLWGRCGRIVKFLLSVLPVFICLSVINANPLFGSDFAYKTIQQTSSNANPSLDNDWDNGFTINGIFYNYEQICDQNLVTHVLYPFPNRTLEFDTIPSTGIPGLNTVLGTQTQGPIPLILIHGWQGGTLTDGLTDPSELITYENSAEKYFEEFIKYFSARTSLTAKYKIYLYKYPSYKHIRYNAKILKELIEKIDYLKNRDVVILAHSMGGLVARSLIEEHKFSRVKTLITLATPHHGSPASMKSWIDRADIPLKNLNTPGAQDLFWDNYDGIFEWAQNDMNIQGDGRNPQIISTGFDDFYRQLITFNALVPVDLVNQTYGNIIFPIHRYPNPWLTYLNEKYRKNGPGVPYIFYGGYDDISGQMNGNQFVPSINNKIVDDRMLVATDAVYDAGYYNDSVVPITSAFLDFSKHDGFKPQGTQNSELFQPVHDGEYKSALYANELIVDPNKYIYFQCDLNQSCQKPVRLFKDYHHDRMRGDVPINDFRTEAIKQQYLNATPLKQTCESVSNPLFDAIHYDLLTINDQLYGALSSNFKQQGTNSAIDEATVELFIVVTNNKVASITTNSSGGMLLTGLASGEYYLKVSKIGFNTFTSDSVTVSNGVTTTIPTIYLTPASTTPVNGTLSISTMPVNGVIYVDGQNKGTGSWNGSLVAGSYSVTFGPVSGYNTPAAQTAVVIGGQTTQLIGTYTNISNPVISGYARTSDGSAISGVTMVFENNGSVSTDVNGFYAKSVNSGWNGTVTPSKNYYIFSQPKAYSSVTSNQTNQNYTGTYLTPTITLTSPNGAEDWQKGTQHNITWNSQGSVGSTVKIELYKADMLNSTITLNVSNSGSYSWLVPDTLTAGTDYKIRVTSMTNTACLDESNGNFLISAGLADFKSYWYWDFDTDGSEGWTGRNATDEDVYATEYWIVDPVPDIASKSGIVSPDGLTLINTNTYNAIEVRAAVKNSYVPSLQAYFKINNQWYGPKVLNYISGAQQNNSQIIYRGTIDYTGQIQQVRVDFVYGDNAVDDRVYVDYVKFIAWSDNTIPVVTISAPYQDEQVIINMPKTIQFSASDNIIVDHIDILYSTDGGSTYAAIPGYTGLSGNTLSCTWIPAATTNSAVIKIKAYDAAGNVGESSRSFKVMTALSCSTYPPTPDLYDPGIYTENNYFVLNWQRVSTATGYILEESISPSFTNPVQYTYAGTETISAALSNKANGIYYYHLKAINDCGESWWSAWIDIEVRKNAAPYVPSNPNPTNGASNIGRTPTLQWNGGDPDGTADYFLELGTSAGNMSSRQGYGSANAYNTSFVVPFTLEPATTYYWRVKSKDNQGIITEGPIWSFTTAYEYPDIAITAFTVNGAIRNESAVTANVTLQNQGNYAAPGAKMKFFYSTTQNGENNEFIYDSTNFSALNPGQSTTITKQLTLTNIVAGMSYLVAKADTAGYFTENNFGNNKLSHTINYADTTGPDISYFDFRWSGNGTFKTDQNVQFVYTVTDDIGVSGIDLYYSTDNGTTWNVVAANLPITNGGYGNFYNWTIPADTPLNSTFKVKIIAKDTTGNSSLSMLGPFTILDGSKPMVTITSPVAGEVWSLGSTNDIKWNASSPSGITQVKIWYYYGNADYITTINSNPGVFSWSIANVPGYATTNGRINIKVTDGNGNESETWSSYFSVVDTSLPPPAPWSAPGRLTTVTTISKTYTSQDDSNGVIAVDQAGNVHMVYKYVEDDLTGIVNGTGPRVIVQKLLYMKNIGTSWTAATEVYSKTTNTDGNLVGYFNISDLQIAIDGTNNPHIAWLSSKSGACIDYNQNEIYYSYFNGSNWSVPVNVSNNSTYSGAPRIAIDSSNNIHFVWNDGRSWFDTCSSSGTANLYHKIKYANGSWSNASIIEGMGGYYPALAKGSNGYVHLASISDNNEQNMVYSYWNGTQWMAPTIISSEGSTYYKNIAVDENNNLHIVYDLYGNFGNGHEHTVKYSVFNGSSWSNPELITEYSNGYLKNPKIALNTNNYPHIIWYEQTPDGDRILYKQKTISGWSSAIKLNTDGNSPVDSNISSAISQSNILHTVWTSMYDGHQEIFYNYADVSTDFIAPFITITAPTTGEILSIGSAYNISWSASDNVNVSNVSLKYTTDDGSTFTTIADSLSNSGSYSWTVPNISSDTVQIFIIVADVAGNQTMTNSGRFKITDKTGPSITITSPVGGELWDNGTSYNITWQVTDTSGVDSINIYYSSNGGTTWSMAATSEANDGTYTWITPNTASSNFKIKIIATDNNGNASSAVTNEFSVTIANNQPAIPYSPVPITSSLVSGSTASLQWECNDADSDALTYSVYFGTNTSPPLVSGTQSEKSYTAPITANTTYYWKVVAADGKTSVTSPLWSFTTAEIVNAPVNLTANHLSASQINIIWTDSSSNEEGFKIERKAGISGTYTEIASVTANVTSYTDTGLSGHSEYIYRIKSYKGDVYSEYSNEVWAVTANNLPNQPLLVSPTDKAIKQHITVILSWVCSDLDNDTITYDVYLGTTSNPPLVSTGQTGVSYMATSLSYGTIYYWKVVAKDVFNAVSESSLSFFITEPQPIPSAPMSLNAVIPSSTRVDLSWTDTSDNEIGFKIERKQGVNGVYIPIANTIASSYSDTTIIAGNEYFYRITSYNSSGESAYSNIVNYTPIYVDTQAPATSISPQGGNYSSTQSVVLECSDGNGSGCINTFFTTDGSDPTITSSVYSGAIPISANTTLKFFSIDNAGNSEPVKTEIYTLYNTLVINKIGTGSGMVNEETGTINWSGSIGSGSFINGTSVILSATADTGSTFTGWSGGDCSGIGNCIVTINSPVTVTANFSSDPTGVTLNAPTLSSPADGATSQPTNVSVTWTDTNSIPQETGYKVRIKPSGGSYTEYSTDQNATSFAVSGLSSGATYYWSVKAVGDGTFAMDSEYPADRSFTVAFCFSQIWQDTIFSSTEGSYAHVNSETLSDGSIIVVATKYDNSGGKVLVYTPNGLLKWEYNTDGSISAQINIDYNRIYITETKRTIVNGINYYSSYIHGLDTNGNKLWQDTIYSSSTEGSNAYVENETLSDGSIIVVATKYNFSGGKVLAYTPNGLLKWVYNTDGYPYVEISMGYNRIYINENQKRTIVEGINYYSSYIHVLDTNGNKLWQDTIYSDSTDQSWAYVNNTTLSDGSIVVEASTNNYPGGKVLAYTPNGLLKWVYNTDGYPYVEISNDYNRIYIIETNKRTIINGIDYYSSYIYGLDTNGNKLWQDTIYSSSTEQAWAHAAYDDEDTNETFDETLLSDGSFIIEASKYDGSGGKVLAYTPNGLLKWVYNSDGSISSQINIDYNRIYITETKRTIVGGINYYSSYIHGLDTNGNKLWQDTIYSASTDQSWAYVNNTTLSDGSIVVEASTNNFSGGKVLAYTPNGLLKWVYNSDGWLSAQVSIDYNRIYITESNKRTIVNGIEIFTTNIYGVDATDNNPTPTLLNVPTLSSPADGATGQASNVSVTWTDTNSSPQDSGYKVRIKPSGGSYTEYSTAQNATSFAVSGLSSGATYYWSVKAVGDGTSTMDSEYPADRSLFTANPDQPTIIFQDNFDDNSIDQAKWSYAGNTVSETSGHMQINTTVTDAGGWVDSAWIPVNRENEITIRKKTLLHYGNNRFIGQLFIYHDGNAGVDTNFIGLNYGNMDNWDNTYCAVKGFYITKNGASPHICATSTSNYSSAIPPVWDQWFDEKIVYNPVSGMLSYYINNEKKTDFNVGPLPESVQRIKISMSSWGWYTGHYHYIDDFSVTQTQPSSLLLTINKLGNGSGAITSNPIGITCGLDCSEGYASGAQISLTAAPDAGSNFTGWSGACTGTAPTCTVTMDAAKSITATFELQTTPSAGPFAYITNSLSDNVSVINTSTKTVVTAIAVGDYPRGVAINPAGTRVYVTNYYSDNVSVIDTSTNTVVATISVGDRPAGIVVDSAGARVYVVNSGSNSVSVINAYTNTVIASIPVGNNPYGVAINPAGTRVYAANSDSDTVSVIDTSSNTIIATVAVGSYPGGIAVNPAGTKVYVVNGGSVFGTGNVSVIDISTNTVVATIAVGVLPEGVAVNPAGTIVYVANHGSNNVSVINTSTNTVVSTIPVGSGPHGIMVNPSGDMVYVANINSDNISVIDTSTNTVVATITVGDSPVAFGQFIGPVLNSNVIKGDIDGLNGVTLADAILALKVVSGLSPTDIRANYSSSGADVNGDGKVGMGDVIYILQVVSGLRQEIVFNSPVVEGWNEGELGEWLPNTTRTYIELRTSGDNPEGYLYSSLNSDLPSDIGAVNESEKFTGNFNERSIKQIRCDLLFISGTITNAMVRFRFHDPGYNGWSYPLTDFFPMNEWRSFSVNFDPTWSDIEAISAGWIPDGDPSSPTMVSFSTTMSDVFSAEVRISGYQNPEVGIDNFGLYLEQ